MMTAQLLQQQQENQKLEKQCASRSHICATAT